MKRGVAKSIVIPQILHHCKQRKESFIVCVEIFDFSKRGFSESVVENKVFSSREPMGSSYFPYALHTAKKDRHLPILFAGDP